MRPACVSPGPRRSIARHQRRRRVPRTARRAAKHRMAAAATCTSLPTTRGEVDGSRCGNALRQCVATMRCDNASRQCVATMRRDNAWRQCVATMRRDNAFRDAAEHGLLWIKPPDDDVPQTTVRVTSVCARGGCKHQADTGDLQRMALNKKENAGRTDACTRSAESRRACNPGAPQATRRQNAPEKCALPETP